MCVCSCVCVLRDRIFVQIAEAQQRSAAFTRLATHHYCVSASEGLSLRDVFSFTAEPAHLLSLTRRRCACAWRRCLPYAAY